MGRHKQRYRNDDKELGNVKNTNQTNTSQYHPAITIVESWNGYLSLK